MPEELPPELPFSLEELLGPKETTTTTISDIPEWLKGYAQDYLKASGNLSFPGGQLGPYPFPDQKVAEWNPWQVEGANLGVRRALSDAPVLSMSEALGLDTLGGKYLDPNTNPALRNNYLNAARDMADVYRYATAPATQASALNAGQFGSANQDQMRFLQQYSLGENLNNLASKMYGENFEQERNRMMQQQQMVPQLLQQQFIGPDYIQKMGQQAQVQKQTVYDTDFKNQQARAQWPYQALDVMRGGLTAMPGGMGSTSQTGPNPNYVPPLAAMMGLYYGSGPFGGGSM